MTTRGLLDLSSGQGGVPPPSSRWKTRIALPALILTGFAGLFAATSWEALSPATVVQASPVVERPGTAAPAAAGASNPAREPGGNVVAQAAGWLEPSPWTTYITALTDGVVEEVLFLEGDLVEEGQLLARLVGDDARLALRRAEAEFAAAEAQSAEMLEKKRNADVTAAMVKEIAASLALARTEVRMEQARLVEAEKADERAGRLIAEGSISDAEQITAETSAETQRARLQAARDRIALLEAQQQRVIAEEQSARRALELRIEETHQLATARVAMEEARLRVSRLEIRAPRAGMVMRRLVEPGGKIMMGMDDPYSAHVAHLYDPAKLQVRVDVPIAEAGRIHAGQRAEVIVEVLPGQPFAAVVSRVTALANVQKNTLEVKVVLDAPAPELKPDMLARVRFFATDSPPSTATPNASRPNTTSNSKAMAVYTPAASVAMVEDRRAAWVVSAYDGQHGHLQLRNLTTVETAADDGWLEVREGLRPGDLVVTAPSATLRPGLRVRVAADHEVASWQ